ncbi:MAG: hypothetical protein WCD66_03180 [Rhodanobacteraceae bacterium]
MHRSAGTSLRPSSERAADDLIRQLSSGAPGRWLATAGALQGLAPEEQWDVLSSPGVGDQPYARLLRHKMGAACSSTLRSLETHAGKDEFDQTQAVVEWCKRLASVGTADEIFENGKANVNDPEWWVPPINADKLSEQEKSIQNRALKHRLQGAKSITELRNTIDALWLLRSRVFGQSWMEVMRLSRYDRGLLHEAVPLGAACLIANGCGPGDVNTIHYCALMPGFQCLEGMSLDDAMRWNLSPRVYRLARTMQAQAVGAYRQKQTGL